MIVMATPVPLFAFLQMSLLYMLQTVEGGNSTASFNNITNLTASNGIVNQLMPTTTPADFKAKKDASYPTSVPPMFSSASRRNRNQGIAMNSSSMQGQSGGIKEGPNSTEPGMEVDGKTGDQDDFPFWVYIVISVGVVLLVVVVVMLYVRMNRWKNHGTYMVWDDNELELSPAFTRESEFLLDNLAADQEPGTPELQIYEIPLDSLGVQRVYIGTKKVAPKTDERREVVKYSKTKKQRRKVKDEFQGNALPRTGRKDHIYSSVNDEVTNTLSEGDLLDGRKLNVHTLPRVLSSTKDLHELDASKLRVNGSSSPEDFVRELRTAALGSGTKSVSSLFQNRPLPPAPSKRFSKSLDRLRFFDALPHGKGKGKTFPCHLKANPLRPHPVLVKSSSFGGTFNKIVKTQPLVQPQRKGSIDGLDKSDTLHTAHVRKSNLCHRHSKSLDTLMLLRDVNWATYDIDIYHPYASVHSSQSDDINEKEPYYASLGSADEKTSSLFENSGGVASPSEVSARSGSEGPMDTCSGENLYATVSDDELSITEGDSRCSNLENDNRDSGVSSSFAGSEDPTSPYASVRISQIQGLVVASLGEESKCKEKVSDIEDSGSSIGKCEDLRENEDFKRASVHTYLELLPDNVRDSVISETSSGYARPADLVSDISGQEDQDLDTEYPRESYTDPDFPTKNFSSVERVERAFELSQSEEYSTNKEENVLLVSDSSPTCSIEEDECSVQSNARLSELFNEAIEDDEDHDFRDPPTKVHIYDSAVFVKNLQTRDTAEQFRPSGDGVPAV
ncbi:uncharacterized protein [Montipora capricornis]|uniref:uncharacterized protein n=1 Tax=Montipora capricornis TaxID=246305 RepID=UPI0035F20684